MSLASLSTTALSLLFAAPNGGFGVGGLATLSKFRFSLLQNNLLIHSYKATKLKFMAEKGASEGPPSKNPVNFSPHVHKLQDVISDNPTGGWEKCWEDGLTPWDLGRPTPIVEHLHGKEMLPKGRALVPGCGSGYDVVALACPERYVIGLDVSDAAIRKAKEASSVRICRMIQLKDIAPAAANNINTEFILLDKGKKTMEGQNMTCLTLVADETAAVHFQLWGDECDAFQPGDKIRLTNGIFSFNRSNLVLRAGKRGWIDKVGEFTVAYVETPNMSEIQWVPDPNNPKKFVQKTPLSPYSRIFPPQH